MVLSFIWFLGFAGLSLLTLKKTTEGNPVFVSLFEGPIRLLHSSERNNFAIPASIIFKNPRVASFFPVFLPFFFVQISIA